ncbi:MAG: cobaltochelatase subunit CobN, partial [Pseudomonadota bacterium]
MHMLAAQPGGFVDDDSIVTRLEQTPADVVILSAADTTLALLAEAHPARGGEFSGHAGKVGAAYPTVRLANLLHLRQHASIDLYVDDVLQHAKVIIVDHLGGESYWPYGTERIVSLCRERSIQLAMFSGDNTEDANLLVNSSVDAEICHALWRYLREGGAANARRFYDFIASTFFAVEMLVRPPTPLPAITVYHPQHALASVADWRSQWQPHAPVVAIIFYRAHLQSGNTHVFDVLCQALQARGLNPLPVALTSLKDPLCLETLQSLCREAEAELVLNTTAFAISALDDEEVEPLAGDVPVFQLIMSGDNQENWAGDAHGLRPRDIAMHVAMPEVDGRIITRPVSFKGLDYRCDLTQTDVVRYQPHEERIAFVARLAEAWGALRRKPNDEKRLALILANYPTREGRLGNGVGLDTPASVLVILRRLAEEGYTVGALPADGDALMRELKTGVTNDPANWPLRPAHQSLAMERYLAFFDALPQISRDAIVERWGPPKDDPMVRAGRFMVAGLRCGQVFVGIQPARGYHLDPMASYHDPDLVPPHAYLAFYCWLREVFACDAMVHVGKHGNLEWLPGKSVALAETCWPDLAFGPTPHLYPFIVNDPGEGTQAKRRAQVVIVDHLMPPLTRAETYGPLQDLERLLDEYYDALTMDPRRSAPLRQQILEHAVGQNLHSDLGLVVPTNEADEQALLNSTDAYLCELKESQIRDGLHVFGQTPEGVQARDTLLALARYPVRFGDGRDASLIRALADDLLATPEFDPLDADWGAPWEGVRPATLEAVDAEHAWRHCGDTRERLELLAQSLIDGRATAQDAEGRGWSATARVLDRLWSDLAPRLEACGGQEQAQLVRGLEGRFVPAGPSGAPSRGRPDVLPTGRNFFSVDTRAIPTATSWQLGWKSAEALLEKYQ